MARGAHGVGAPGAQPRGVVVDARRTTGAVFSRDLFGLGVDYSSGSYQRPGDDSCRPLADVRHGDGITLVRIGATIGATVAADNYDWRTDASYDPQQPRRPHKASPGCPNAGQAASILRVLDRARTLDIKAVVVLNGETDDPRGAYDLARLIAGRYGYPFARKIYWEIGNAPARWRHFGVPLMDRRGGDHMPCSPDQYAALVMSYATAVTAALSDAPPGTPTEKRWPRIVADAWIANATDQAWASVVRAVDTRYYPYTTIGTEPTTAVALARSVTAPPTGGIPLDDVLSSLRANLNQYSGGDTVGLFVGQWGITTDPNPSPASPFYDSYAQAVFVADLMMHFETDGVSMAAWAPPLSLYGSTQYGSTQAPFVDGGPAPGFTVLTALGRLAGARALSKTVSGERDLDTLALRRPDGGVTLVLARTTDHPPVDVPVRVGGGPTHPVGATAQTFSAGADGAIRAITFNPTGTLLSVPTPGVVILTLPAR